MTTPYETSSTRSHHGRTRGHSAKTVHVAHAMCRLGIAANRLPPSWEWGTGLPIVKYVRRVSTNPKLDGSNRGGMSGESQKPSRPSASIHRNVLRQRT